MLCDTLTDLLFSALCGVSFTSLKGDLSLILLSLKTKISELRLPSTYVKWIRTLAGVDNRLLRVLRLIRSGEWTYTRGSPTQATLLTTYAKDLSYPSSWGDPLRVPAFGGPSAGRVWELIGVKGRQGLGGIPCELVHGGVGSKMSLAGSCTGNSGIRGVKAFFEAVLVYLPVSLFPFSPLAPRLLFCTRPISSRF